MDDDWLTVRWNIKRAQKVWGRLGKLPRIEGYENRLVEMLYRELKQAVLLFGLEN